MIIKLAQKTRLIMETHPLKGIPMSKETVDPTVETETYIEFKIKVPPFVKKTGSFVKRHASKAMWFTVGAAAGSAAVILNAMSDDDSDEEALSDDEDTLEIESSDSTTEFDS